MTSVCAGHQSKQSWNASGIAEKTYMLFMQHHAKKLSNNTYKPESSHAMHESQEHGDAALWMHSISVNMLQADRI